MPIGRLFGLLLLGSRITAWLFYPTSLLETLVAARASDVFCWCFVEAARPSLQGSSSWDPVSYAGMCWAQRKSHEIRHSKHRKERLIQCHPI